MIQRIQSIWLLLAAVCAFLSFKFSFYSGNMVEEDMSTKFVELNASTDMIITVLTALLGAGALITIFLFKNRKRQLTITIILLLVSIGILLLYITQQTKKFTEGNYGLTSVIYFAIPILLTLAIVGIRKDDKLIKSLDRLR